jgi:hypothetical protein
MTSLFLIVMLERGRENPYVYRQFFGHLQLADPLRASVIVYISHCMLSHLNNRAGGGKDTIGGLIAPANGYRGGLARRGI